MELFIIILLSSILLCAIIFAILQHYKHKKDKSDWDEITEQKCRQIKEDSYEYARQTFDYISNAKQEYESKTEKEILTDIILALASHSRRIDRIDDKLSCIYNYKAYIDSLNLQVEKLSGFCVVLCEKSNELNDIFSNCRNALQKTSSDLNKLNHHFSDTISLEENIEKCVSCFSEITPTINSLSEKVKKILLDMESTLASCEISPIKRLDNIESLSKEINENLSKMLSDMESFDYNINQIKSDCSNIDSDLSSIKDEFDEYGNNNLYSKIESINSTLTDFHSSIDKIESAVSEYEYNSLYSKIEEIREMISD